MKIKVETEAGLNLAAVKPSEWVQYMCDGLEQQSERGGFSVDMTLFWMYDPNEEMCFGCAATCALQEALGVDFQSDFRRPHRHNSRTWSPFNKEVDAMAYKRVEEAIDWLRIGTFVWFIQVMSELNGFDTDEFTAKAKHDAVLRRALGYGSSGLPSLLTCNWKEQLPHYRELIEPLRRIGY